MNRMSTPGTAIVSAKVNVRDGGPSRDRPVAARLEAGSTIVVSATVRGEAVSGNDRWYETAQGFVWSGACGELVPAPVVHRPSPGKFRPFVPFPELGVVQDVVADEVREPLLALKAAVEQAGGRLERTSLTRTVAEQQALRSRYEAWLQAGMPPPEVAAANKPGRSNHQGGRAIDVRLRALGFPNLAPTAQLPRLWDVALPLGWTPVIRDPRQDESEAWHFDWWGSWAHVRDRLNYDMACLCSALDVGQAGSWQSDGRLGQALLLRGGFDIGEPDGQIGPRTRRALGLALSVAIPDVIDWDSVIPQLRSLPVALEWRRVA